MSVDRFSHGYDQSPSNFVFWKPPEHNDAGTDEETSIQYAQAVKVCLQQSPDNTDMWDAAHDLSPPGKDKDSLIVYLPKGTGQARM